jgi:hypothetical protein
LGEPGLPLLIRLGRGYYLLVDLELNSRAGDGLIALIEDGNVDYRRRRGLPGQHTGVAPQQHRNAKRTEPYHPASILTPV